jgi:hypothetical protein
LSDQIDDNGNGGETIVERARDATRLEGGSAGPPPTAVEGVAPRARRYVRIALPPALEDDYEIQFEIPVRGAEADLAVARHHPTGESRVVKLFRVAIKAPDRALLDRLASGDPKHVVQVYERGESAGMWYEVLEYCSEGSLAKLIETEGPAVPVARVREVLDEIVPALRHIHAKPIEITHRDFKPANVLVRTLKPFDLVLADFGLSTILGDASQVFASGSRTPAYAAPEAAAGMVSQKLDWWSLGVTLIEMLTGRHPLRVPGAGDREEQIIAAHLSTMDLPLDGIDDDRWRLLCAGLTTRNPQQRWGGAEVEEWMRGGSPKVHKAPDGAPPARKAKPFPFRALQGAGTMQYTDPVEVAAALGRHWDDALGIVRNDSGHRRQNRQLRDFLQSLELAGADGVLTSADGTEVDRLMRLRLAIDPDAEPVFEAVDLGGGRLAQLAASGAAGDQDAANVLSHVLDHGVLTLHDGDGPREGWAALESAWLENSEWLERALPDERQHLEGAGDLDEAATAVNRSRLLHLLLDEGARHTLQSRADEQRDDRRALDIGFFPPAVERVGRGPRPARDLLIALLHDAATAIGDRRDAERRAADAKRRRQMRHDFGAACRRVLLVNAWTLFVLSAACFGGLALGLLQVPRSGKAATADGVNAALMAIGPAAIAVLVGTVLVGVAFNVMTFARDRTGGYASPGPSWQGKVVVLAPLIVAGWAALAAEGPSRVAVAAPSWIIIAAGVAYVLCILFRLVLSEAGESVVSIAQTLVPPVLLGVAVVIGGVGAQSAISAETDHYRAGSERLAQSLQGVALQDCAPVATGSRPITFGWLEARALCHRGSVLVTASLVDRRGSAIAVADAVMRSERKTPLKDGASCATGSAVRPWRSGRLEGRLLCYRHGPFARITYNAPDQHVVVDLRRKGDSRALYRWWRRHATSVVNATAPALP